MSEEWLKHQKNIFLTVEELQTPPVRNGVFRTLVDHYWMFQSDDTTVLYQGVYPQCNANKRIAEKVSQKRKDTKVIHIPIAYIPLKYEE